MNTQRTLLLGIIITAVAILFVETGVIQFNNQGINAQTELSELILEKDGERVTISKGDWVIAINAANSDIFGGGELLGVTAEGILTRESAKDLERSIAIQDIGVLYHGNYKRTSKYIWQGVRSGGSVALGIGILLGISVATGGLLDMDGGNPQMGLLCVPVGTVFFGIFTVPAGVVIGFIQGKVAEGKAVEYIIGPDDWQFVLEQPPVSY
ncbi:uncharacterized protein METZ01_LOCUS147061 [marine metagenome]|uniref:Uncharacterized protein n=1 Tax=marine metagenome TaxID=408172 RepID=A0A381ZZD7_9ZZZZ